MSRRRRAIAKRPARRSPAGPLVIRFSWLIFSNNCTGRGWLDPRPEWYGLTMVTRWIRLPEHDLTLRLVSGEHTSADAFTFFGNLDSSCATRWLSYFDATVSMARVDVASMPEMKHIISQKQKELFGDKPKPYAVVCRSESADQYFIQFWEKYYARSGLMRCFRRVEDAYDWLGLSPSARAAVGRVTHDWEMARAVDAWEVADGCAETSADAAISRGPGKAPPQAPAWPPSRPSADAP